MGVPPLTGFAPPPPPPARKVAKQPLPYGRRRGFVPRHPEDFGDGGAFPEIPVAQFPLGMAKPGGKPRSENNAVVPVNVGADEEVRGSQAGSSFSGRSRLPVSTPCAPHLAMASMRGCADETVAASESVEVEKTGPDDMMPGMKRQSQPANRGKEEISAAAKRGRGKAGTVKKAGVEHAGASMASFSALPDGVSVIEQLKAAERDGSTVKKRFEQWVRDDPNLGNVGELPYGLSFDRGGTSSKIYKRLIKRFRRAQGGSRDLRTGRERAYGNGAYGPCRGQREERRKQFEIWVRDNTDEGFGAKGELPDGLSFGKGGSTTAIYQRQNKQFRRALGRCNKDMTGKELEERHIAEQLNHAEQELECETQVARAVSELTDSDLLRELAARGLDCYGTRSRQRPFGRGSSCARLEAAVSAAKSAAAAAAAEEGGDAFTYKAFYAGYVDPYRPRWPRLSATGGSEADCDRWMRWECDRWKSSGGFTLPENTATTYASGSKRCTPFWSFVGIEVCSICEEGIDDKSNVGCGGCVCRNCPQAAYDCEALFCDMCCGSYHLGCVVDPSSAKVDVKVEQSKRFNKEYKRLRKQGLSSKDTMDKAKELASVEHTRLTTAEECNLMVQEDTSGASSACGHSGCEERQCLLLSGSAILEYYDFERLSNIRRPAWVPAKNETWLCSSCQQKQAAPKTGLCYSRSNVQF